MDRIVPERVIAARREQGLSQSQLGVLVGSSQGTIQRIEAGETLSPRKLLKLASVLKRTPEYLTGETDDPSPNHFEERQRGFRHMEAVNDPRLVEVAGIDLNFGLGGAFMDQEIVEHQAERLVFPAAWLRQITTTPAEHLYWTSGVGNSMEPAISDGDVILIDRSKVGSSFGDLYWAIAYGQTGMIKRLRPMPDGSVKILSDNQSVPPEIAYDGELHVFGRVVAVVRKV